MSLFPSSAIGVGLGFIICIVAHHYAHARVGISQGDWTSKQYGRTSLSIKAHADTLGTIILPIVWIVIVLFGDYFPMVAWGKPQPMESHRLRHGRRSIILVALAGPLATLVIGVVAGIASRSLPYGSHAYRVVAGIAVVGILLTIWELLPMPGRDGGRILGSFLKPAGRLKMQELAEYEVLFVVGAFFLLLGPINALAGFVCDPVANQAFGGCKAMLGMPL